MKWIFALVSLFLLFEKSECMGPRRAIDFEDGEVVEIKKFASLAYGKVDDIEGARVFSLNNSNTKGFVKKWEINNILIVAFRGTKNMEDVFVDIKAEGDDSRYVNYIKKKAEESKRIDFYGREFNGMRVHAGFSDEIRNLCDVDNDGSLYRILNGDEFNNFNEIVFTGHSMGAALAQLYALRYCADKDFDEEECKKVKVFAFSSPKIFNEIAAGLYYAAIGELNSIHFFNSSDIVKHMPPTKQDWWVLCSVLKGYLGDTEFIEIGIQGNVGSFSKNCCNSLNKYTVIALGTAINAVGGIATNDPVYLFKKLGLSNVPFHLLPPEGREFLSPCLNFLRNTRWKYVFYGGEALMCLVFAYQSAVSFISLSHTLDEISDKDIEEAMGSIRLKYIGHGG